KYAFIILVAHVVFPVPFVGLYISIPFPCCTFSFAFFSHCFKYLNCCTSHLSGLRFIFFLYFSGMFDNLYITSVCIFPKQCVLHSFSCAGFCSVNTQFILLLISISPIILYCQLNIYFYD